MGDLDSALSWFFKAGKIEPQEPSVAKEAGLCAGVLGKHGLAIRLMKSAAAAHPGDAALQCNIGLSYLMSERLDEARTSFCKAIDAEPGDETNQRLLELVEGVADGRIPCPRTEQEISRHL
jgi:Flp pilus assembly protein TadD